MAMKIQLRKHSHCSNCGRAIFTSAAWPARICSPECYDALAKHLLDSVHNAMAAASLIDNTEPQPTPRAKDEPLVYVSQLLKAARAQLLTSLATAEAERKIVRCKSAREPQRKSSATP